MNVEFAIVWGGLDKIDTLWEVDLPTPPSAGDLVCAPDGAATYEVMKTFWYPAGRYEGDNAPSAAVLLRAADLDLEDED